MDYADDDAVRRYERFESALMALALEGDLEADRVMGATFLAQMKREALVNAAIQPDDALAAKIARGFPGIDVVKLVNAMRVKAVELRLGGGDVGSS